MSHSYTADSSSDSYSISDSASTTGSSTTGSYEESARKLVQGVIRNSVRQLTEERPPSNGRSKQSAMSGSNTESSTDSSSSYSDSARRLVQGVLRRSIRQFSNEQSRTTRGSDFSDFSVMSELDMYAESAHKLVDDVIEIAIRKLEEEDYQRQETLSSLSQDGGKEIVYKPPVKDNFETANITWLTIGEFKPEEATSKIRQYIETWEFQDSWLHCIDYLGVDILEFDDRHRFRVRWSIPTRRKPIPRATASVYFTFQVSNIKPRSYPVDVFFVLEGHRLVHRPGNTRFREKWLKDIIESKVRMIESVNF